MKGIALLLSLGLSVACGGSSSVSGARGTTPSSKADDGSPPAPIAASLYITLEFDVGKKSPPTTVVSLVQTDEMGANKRHNLGEFDGECKDVTLAVRQSDPEVFLAFHCQPYGTQRGALVQILKRRGQLILLRAWLGSSKPTFDDFDQIGELPPVDAGVPMISDYD